MTARELQQVRDLIARNHALEKEVAKLKTEVAFLRRRAPLEPRIVKSLRDRLDQQRARAELWRTRCLGRST